jgi:hypothetical protein
MDLVVGMHLGYAFGLGIWGICDWGYAFGFGIGIRGMHLVGEDLNPPGLCISQSLPHEHRPNLAH